MSVSSLSMNDVKKEFDQMEREFADLRYLKISEGIVDVSARFSAGTYCRENGQEIDLREPPHVVFWAQASDYSQGLSSEVVGSLTTQSRDFARMCRGYEALSKSFKDEEEYKRLRSAVRPVFGAAKASGAPATAPVLSKELSARYEELRHYFQEMKAHRETFVKELQATQRLSFERGVSAPASSEMPLEERAADSASPWLGELFTYIRRDFEDQIASARSKETLDHLAQSLKIFSKEPEVLILDYFRRVMTSSDVYTETEVAFVKGLVDFLGRDQFVFGQRLHQSRRDKRHQAATGGSGAQQTHRAVQEPTAGPFNVNHQRKHGVLKDAEAKRLVKETVDHLKSELELRTLPS